MLYNLDEICLIPAKTTDIKHRNDVVIYNTHDKLPLFTAPMHSVVTLESRNKFEDAGINTIIPRTVVWEERNKYINLSKWVAVGFKEAKYIANNPNEWKMCPKLRLCIDQANGHMSSLIDLCKELKRKFGGRISIMTGNIANPYVYKAYAKAGIDYIRAGIGGGAACTTSVQTGVHYPMGSLLIELNEQKRQVQAEIKCGAKYSSIPKIVADGGINRIDQIVKALALGADYVMIGKLFAKTYEACNESENAIFDLANNKYKAYREYFGMSTEKAQLLINEASMFKQDDFEPKHSEGQVQRISIDYTLAEWIDDFKHALKSCMSYCNTNNLNNFIGKAQYNIMSVSTFNSYMK